MAADQVEECWQLLRQSMRSVSWECLAHLPSYSAWLRGQDWTGAYRRHRRNLQLIGLGTDRRWVLKNPSHLFALDALLAVYPDALIVQTHRAPDVAIASVCSLAAQASAGWSDTFTGEVIGRDQLELWASGLERFGAERARHDPARFFDVSYDDLVADPVGTAESVYAHFGLPLSRRRGGRHAGPGRARCGPGPVIPPVHAGRLRADRGEGGGAVRTCDNRRVSTTGSGRRADVVQLAGELFAQKGYRATTVREIADAAGILSGSLYHHFDSKESIGDEILSGFINDVLADYRAAVASGGSPREVLEQIVRSTSQTLARHRPALAMLQNDWSYFSGQPRFGYLRKAVGEIERTWVTQLERGKKEGIFRADLDARLTYRLLRDVLWIPSQWRLAEGYSTEQVADTLLQLLFDGITARS